MWKIICKNEFTHLLKILVSLLGAKPTTTMQIIYTNERRQVSVCKNKSLCRPIFSIGHSYITSPLIVK